MSFLFGQCIIIPKQKIGHNQKGTTLEPLSKQTEAKSTPAALPAPPASSTGSLPAASAGIELFRLGISLPSEESLP